MKSISFYIITTIIKLKGIKSIFSIAPINYFKLRKSDIKTPNKKHLLNQESNKINIKKTILTEIIPINVINEEKIILYCPGGAFVYGPTDTNWKFCSTIAKETKLRSFLIDYPKAPEVTIEEINANIDAVYDFLVEQKSIKNIAMIGDSVGGTLLMLLVQRLVKIENAIVPKSIYLISPVTDCSLTNPEILLKDKNDIMLSRNGILSAKLMCAGNINLKSEIISPLYGSFKNFIPTYLFIVENDIMQPDQERLVDKMIIENVNFKVYRGHDMPHIWPLLPVMKEAKDALNTIIENIKNNT
nr:alpha/beta hydrolase [uncultured Flavobacterium sp.]